MALARNTCLTRSAGRAVLFGLAAAATVVTGLTVPASAASRPPAPAELAVVTRGPAHYLTWRQSGTVTKYFVKQATDRAFTRNVRTYVMRYPGRAFTPYGLTSGTTYYFRVRAAANGLASASSATVSFVAGRASGVRVVSYNSLSATYDGKTTPGGVVAPWSKRRPRQLDFLLDYPADVVGIQEAASCLVRYQSKPCYRQVDSLAAGLATRYKFVDTSRAATGTNRYFGSYIFHRASVAPVGAGGTWPLGPGRQHAAAYQAFRVVQTGAKFLFVNTHLYTPNTSAGDDIRATETQRMLSHANDYAQKLGITSIIYVGDFNSYYGQWRTHDRTGNIMRAARIMDGVHVAQSLYKARYDSTNHLHRTARKGHGSVDHVFATSGVGIRTWGEMLNIRSGVFVGTIPSDHNPVYAALTVPY